MTSNHNLLEVLNDLYDRPKLKTNMTTGRPALSGRAQITANALQCTLSATKVVNSASTWLQLGECELSNNSRDGRGRPQKSIRVTLENVSKKLNFRPWHLTWIAKNGKIPDCTKQYSHLCHNETCINPNHGVWETDQANKDRNHCRTASLIRLPNGAILKICPHQPPCLVGRDFISWTDPDFLQLGMA